MRKISILRNTKNKGFTLLELLTVIAVIAVLTAILFPMVSRAMASAQRAKASSNLRQICLAYVSYGHEGGTLRSIRAETPNQWAAQLARYTGLNEASLYFVDGDPALEGINQPSSILASPNDTASFEETGFAQAPWLTPSHQVSIHKLLHPRPPSHGHVDYALTEHGAPTHLIKAEAVLLDFLMDILNGIVRSLIQKTLKEGYLWLMEQKSPRPTF